MRLLPKLVATSILPAVVALAVVLLGSGPIDGRMWFLAGVAILAIVAIAVPASMALALPLERSLSDLRDAADALSGSMERYRNLVERAPQAIFVHADDHFLYVNPAGRNLMRITEDLTGAPIGEIVDEGSRTAWRSLLRGDDGDPSQTSTEVELIDGTTLRLEAVSLAMEFSGTPARLVVVDDVTERRQMEDERRTLEEQMRQVQKLESLGLVAGGIAHDFNNMLTAIMGNNELVLMELPEDSVHRPPLEQVRRATQKASELTRQMLAYAGRGQFVLSKIDLGEAVREIGDLLASSISKKATLKMELSQEFLAVEADPVQIQQVVMNLITNANEALGDDTGTITLKTGTVFLDETPAVHTLGGLPRGHYALLEVTDTGCGMDAATRERMFDPFFTTKMTGRGLGLAGVLGIVRSHLGDLEVYTEPGRGTRFRVFLPKASHPFRDSKDLPIDDSGFYGTGVVLVADDEPPVRHLTRRILERYGFEVACVEDGAEALEVYEDRRERIVCALLDVTMPKLDGWEVKTRLRQQNPKLPIVLMSGYDDREAEGSPAKDQTPFVVKPFRVSVLIDAIRSAMAYAA